MVKHIYIYIYCEVANKNDFFSSKSNFLAIQSDEPCGQQKWIAYSVNLPFLIQANKNDFLQPNLTFWQIQSKHNYDVYVWWDYCRVVCKTWQTKWHSNCFIWYWNFHLIMSSVVVVVVPTPFMVLPTLDSSPFLAKDGKQKAAECTWKLEKSWAKSLMMRVVEEAKELPLSCKTSRVLLLPHNSHSALSGWLDFWSLLVGRRWSKARNQ